MRRLLRLLLKLLYGFRTENEAVLQTPGPVLLVPNHVSWLDWLFLGVCLDWDWKFVVSSQTARKSWLHRKIMLNRRTFPIDVTSPFAVKRIAEFLETGGRLVLFAEGRLSKTGTLLKLFDGTGFLLHKTRAGIITCYIRGAQRLPFSPNRETKRWFPRVSAHFSDVLRPPQFEHLSTSAARTRLTRWLRDRMIQQQFEVEMMHGPGTLPEAILQTARWFPRRVVLEDLNQSLNYRRLLTGTLLISRVLKQRLPARPERVGVLLPNVNAMPVTLLALWSLGRVPAVLNYSTGVPAMLACARLAELKHVITSRVFLARAGLDLKPFHEAGIRLIYLEDLRQEIGLLQRLTALGRVTVNPRAAFAHRAAPEDTAVVLFTSGSEGVPKGVELTHRNILANARQILSVTDVQDWDRLFNALPLFHSFGLTIGCLLPLARGIYVRLYPSPLHYRVVPTMVYLSDCTVLLSTGTFLNGYARKAHPADFRSLRYLFAGAEKLQTATWQTWVERFGVRILEGYGATECSPVLSVNTPFDSRLGTAGRFLPGIEYRLEPVEGVSEGGRLWVRGPNVMRGYLNPEANAAFQSHHGWYDTGDIAHVDEEGFVTLLGRAKRFAKISGEMVSLTAVEEALAGAFPRFGLRCEVAIVSVPDTDKGEALIAVTNEPRLTLGEIRNVLRAKGLPNLCVPREVRYLKEIPHLGTGKVSHRELVQMLQAEVAVPAAS